MNIEIRLGPWDEMKAPARDVRYQVFVIEQKVPVELEWDDMDPHCMHALALDGEGKPVATGRLLPDGHIGRMAVLADWRGTGLGGAILRALMDQARQRGDREVVLSAQTHAEPFYLRHGFVREGEEFVEAGIPHVSMRHAFPA